MVLNLCGQNVVNGKNVSPKCYFQAFSFFWHWHSGKAFMEKSTSTLAGQKFSNTSCGKSMTIDNRPGQTTKWNHFVQVSRSNLHKIKRCLLLAVDDIVIRQYVSFGNILVLSLELNEYYTSLMKLVLSIVKRVFLGLSELKPSRLHCLLSQEDVKLLEISWTIDKD